ncbi:hypothetical protein FCV38_10100 [Clostridium sporogenes]|nr:hypothetical protein [Clostridium sporogenes]
MNNLIKLNNENVPTIESREVAKMVEKDHSKLMRDIRTYCKYLNEAKIGLVKYFIESNYKDSKGEKRPCYLITKMGCEMVANKLTGSKGVIFTAKYVEKFNEMEKHIKQENQFKLPQNYKEALLQLVAQVEENEKLQEDNKILDKENDLLSAEVLKWGGKPLINAVIRRYGSSLGNFSEGWIAFKKEVLYRYSINLNSRITHHLNTTGKRTKPKTLDMLYNEEEIANALSTAIAMCREKDIDISDLIKKYCEDDRKIKITNK